MPVASITVLGIVVPNNPRTIREDEVARYRADGWQVVPDTVVETKQEPVETPVLASVVDAAPVVKKGRGRPRKE